MNEDPTRLMDYGDEPPRRRRPPQNQPKGNLRLVVLIMGVVIFGLLIGLLASCGGGSTKTVKVTRTVTEEVPVPAKETAQEKEEKEANGESTESTESGEEEPESTEEIGGVEEGEVEEFLPEELEEGVEVEEPPVEEGEIFEEPEGGGVGAE
jgi:hypothetical protein